jgi:hypothetical protein
MPAHSVRDGAHLYVGVPGSNPGQVIHSVDGMVFLTSYLIHFVDTKKWGINTACRSWEQDLVVNGSHLPTL